MYTETAVLFGEIIFQEERMRVKGVALHMPWRGWYIEHDIISKMQHLFISNPDQYSSSFSEFTRILSTFPAQSLSHQFFFQPLYDKNYFPVIFIEFLANPALSSETAQIIFYLWQMATRAGPELQQKFVKKVGEVSQNNNLRPLIRSLTSIVSFNTLKIIELLFAEASANLLIENTIYDIIDVFFEHKKRNVDHWYISVILGLIFNNPDFRGGFLQQLLKTSRLLERICVLLQPEIRRECIEIIPYIREVGKMLPEEVKTPQWRAMEENLLLDVGSASFFEISDELRSRYQKNSKSIQNYKGLKTVLDMTE